MNRSPDEVLLTTEEFEASLDAVTAALDARAHVQKARRRLRVVSVFAAAASVALVAALWGIAPGANREGPIAETSGVVSDVTSARAHDLVSGAPIEAGQRVKTDASGALTLRFPEGTMVAVGARSALGIHGLGRHRSFELEEGHFEAQVAKLKADETFVVETRRARVEVRGTQFTVDVERPSDSCRDGSVVVKVKEGIVAVSSGDAVTEVKAGESKVLPCSLPPPVPTRELETPEPPPTPRPVREAGSRLSRLNAMYGKAMDLKQRGQLDEAAHTFRELRRAFPKSELDEAAAVEELRALQKLDSERGPAAAREYLRDYPEGYGRDLAEGLLE